MPPPFKSKLGKKSKVTKPEKPAISSAFDVDVPVNDDMLSSSILDEDDPLASQPDNTRDEEVSNPNSSYSSQTNSSSLVSSDESGPVDRGGEESAPVREREVTAPPPPLSSPIRGEKEKNHVPLSPMRGEKEKKCCGNNARWRERKDQH